MCVTPDGAAGVAEDGGSEALSDADQAGPVNLHDEVVHQDPAHRHKGAHVGGGQEVSFSTLNTRGEIRRYCFIK